MNNTTSKVPACAACDFCRKEAIFTNGKKHEYCHHPIWRITRALKKRWIRAKEKGATSPSWCPLRVKSKEE